MAIKNKHWDNTTSKITRQEKPQEKTEYFNIKKMSGKNDQKIPETKMSWC